MKTEYHLVIMFVITLSILGWLIYSHLDNPKLGPLLLVMVLGIVGTLFAVFGKELFSKQQSRHGVEHE